MDYKETIEWLFSRLPMFSRVGAAAYKPGLENVEKLDAFFGHPHRRYRSIHIAGTNGKGSVSNMLASILMESGLKVGLYTSPHLVDFRERIRVNGEMISEDGVIDFVERFKTSGFDGNPSFFELTMMMAFDWFARCGVDIAVIEVGMGGRLDSTNIITPELCVITNISPDHKQFLGATPAAIAGEKAGIIKSGVPVIIGRAEGEVREVFRKKAEEVGAPLIEAFAGPEVVESKIAGDLREMQTVSFGRVVSPLLGCYQIENCNTSLVAAKEMMRLGIVADADAVRKGMADVEKNTSFRGRWTKIADSPYTIADTGHNIDGLTANVAQIKAWLASHEGASLRIVMGFVADKEIESILKILPEDAEYYLTNAKIPRALPAAQLAEKFRDAGLNVALVEDDVTACYTKALQASAAGDFIYVGGSTFVVADLFEHLL